MVHSLRVRLLLTLIVVVFVAVGTVALLASRVTASELQRFVSLDTQRNRRVIDTLIAYYRQGQGADNPAAMARRMAEIFGERVLLTDGDGRVLANSRGELAGQTLGCDAGVSAIVVALGRTSCIGAAAPEQIGYGAGALDVRDTSDVLFFSSTVSDAIALEPGLAGAALSLDPAPAELRSAQVFDTIVLGQGSGQPGGPLALPAITIRRIHGRVTDPIETGFISTVNRSLVLAVGAAGLAAVLLTIVLSRRILGPVEALTAAAQRMEQGDLGQRVAVRTRDEIGALAHAFNAMAESLARNEQLRRHMVTDVAHELRTPLTNVRGYVEALRDGVAAPDHALFNSLHEETLLLNRLIDDLQDLALAEAGQLRLARRPTALGLVVEQAASALRPALAGKRLGIAVDLQGELPDVDADAERVGQVLRNLLNNAITHTPPGGTIALRAERMTDEGRGLSASARVSSFILIEVRDSGPGIAPEHLPYIFERFYRGDPSRARATGGAGLGLTIVRQLVEAHGGRVWAESAPGQGTAFTFTLPVAR